MVKIMIAEGIAQKIDVASMPNFKNVMSPHDNPSYDPGRQHSAPYMWGTTDLTYDPRVPGGKLEESWKEFFEPREELGRSRRSMTRSSSTTPPRSIWESTAAPRT